MKKLLVFTLVVCIVSIGLMILHFMASTDVYHDYIGTSIRARGLIANLDQMPEWTKCKYEWMILTIDYYLRFAFMILITVVLIKLIWKEK